MFLALSRYTTARNGPLANTKEQLVSPHARGALLELCSVQLFVLAAPAKRKKETTESAMPSRGIALSLILDFKRGESLP